MLTVSNEGDVVEQVRRDIRACIAEHGALTPAFRTLVRLLTWRPKLRVNPEALPKGFLRLLHRARKTVKRLPRGKLTLVTKPPRAKAYLNGRSVGRTPFTLEGVPVGSHYLTLRRRGYLRARGSVLLRWPRSVTRSVPCQ